MSQRDFRASILELAIQVIDEHGETAIRTNHLAAEAGTTPPTLYHYFGSREGLIEEAQAERFFRSLVADAEMFFGRLADVEDRDDLRTELRALFSRRDTPERVEVRWKRLNALGSAFAREGLTKRIAEMHNRVVDRAAEVLEPFQERGLIRRDIDVRAVVAWYNGAVLGKVLATIDDSHVDVGEWERTMNEAILFTLFGSDGPERPHTPR